MIGTRTKHINVYGKRIRRIVDVSDHLQSLKDAQNIFDDLPPVTLAPVTSRMKKRENPLLAKPKSSPPKVVGLQRKKRLSPVLSPARRRRTTRAVQIIKEDAPAFKGIRNPKLKLQSSPKSSTVTGLRAPLSLFSPNVPSSQAAFASSDKSRKKPLNERLPKIKKPFAPFIDVDIIVLDNEGRTFQQEQRCSRPTISSKRSTKRLERNSCASPGYESEEGEIDAIDISFKPSLRAPRRAIPVILSDDSDIEMHVPIPPAHLPRIPVSPTLISRQVKSDQENICISACTWSSSEVASHDKPPTQIENNDNQLISHRIPPTNVPIKFRPFSSPLLRARQLTPIRGSRKVFPHPPSPTTPSDFNLSLELSGLDIGLPCQLEPDAVHIPDHLRALLVECGQEVYGPHEFSAFIESFPYDPIVSSSGSSPNFRKIGEASFSEVFGIGNVVLKVIPLRDETPRKHRQEEDEGPAPSDAKDVKKEIIVTRAMCNVHDGYVTLLKSYIVRGRYPDVLLKLWDEYNEHKGSDSIRPDTFLVSQVYAIIVLPNGGPDLEAYTFSHPTKTGWRQACSVFWQVAKSLAHAEQLVSFEHRDLHWGQVLIKDLLISGPQPPLASLNTNARLKSRATRVFMDDPTHGVQVTIIDLGLSRMDAGDGSGGVRVHYTPFDEEVFMGEGDYQFDVYRMMKKVTGGEWEGFHPLTNVMWLHYLSRKLIQSKGLRVPTVPRKLKEATSTMRSAPFTERECYECLLDIEDWLSRCLASYSPGKLKANVRRKTMAARILEKPSMGVAYSGEIIEYGVKKGWIRAST